MIKEFIKTTICCLFHRWHRHIDAEHGYYFCYCVNCNEWVWKKRIKNTMSDAPTNQEEKQSKAFCECGHETLQDPRSKIYDAGSHVNIICSNCGRQSSWDLDAPVPIFLRSIK